MPKFEHGLNSHDWNSAKPSMLHFLGSWCNRDGQSPNQANLDERITLLTFFPAHSKRIQLARRIASIAATHLGKSRPTTPMEWCEQFIQQWNSSAIYWAMEWCEYSRTLAKFEHGLNLHDWKSLEFSQTFYAPFPGITTERGNHRIRRI